MDPMDATVTKIAVSNCTIPSHFFIELPIGSKFPKQPFVMTLSNFVGDGDVSLRSCIFKDFALSEQNVFTVTILDRRWKWEYPRVSGKYNDHRDETKSVRALAEICL